MRLKQEEQEQEENELELEEERQSEQKQQVDANQTQKISDQIQELRLASIHSSKVPSSRRSRSEGQRQSQQIMISKRKEVDIQAQQEQQQQQFTNKKQQEDNPDEELHAMNRGSSSVLDFVENNKSDTRTRNQREQPKLSYQNQPRVSQSMMMPIKSSCSQNSSSIQTHNKMSVAVANFRAILQQSKQFTNNIIKKKDQPINLYKQQIINSREFLNGNFISPIKSKKLSQYLPETNQKNYKFNYMQSLQTKNSIDLLSPLNKKALQFDGLQISMATALRYVKISDLQFLLQDYQPDKMISASEFKKIVQLLKDSVLGNDSNLPQNIFEAAVAQMWEIIQKVQRRRRPIMKITDDNQVNLDVSDVKEQKMTWACITVVAPVVILFTRGSIQERLSAIFDIISQGKKLINFEQTEQFLFQIYELMFELGASPLKASQNKLEPNELATHAAKSIYRTIGHNPDTEYISAKLLHIWLLNPISPVQEEDQQDYNVNQSGCQLSNQSTLTIGVDNSLFKTFGELKKKMVQKPAQVPPLDLKNTQAMKKLQDKCNKMISMGTKLNEKEYKRKYSRSVLSIVNSVNDSSSSSSQSSNNDGESRKFNQPQKSKRNLNCENNQSASQSLERLPSERTKNGLLSPNRRIIPQKVKKFSKLCVVDLDISAHNRSRSYVTSPKYQNCYSQKSIKGAQQQFYNQGGILNIPPASVIHNSVASQENPRNCHSKCQSMFLQTKQFQKESLTQFYKNFQRQMQQNSQQSSKQGKKPLSPVNKVINIPDIHIKSPEDKLCNNIKIKKCQDEVRFSVDPSIDQLSLLKSPYKQGKSQKYKHSSVPKTLLVKVNDTHNQEKNQLAKVSSFVSCKQNSISNMSSISSSLATFAPNKILGSPQKKRNIKIAVLDYFLKH